MLRRNQSRRRGTELDSANRWRSRGTDRRDRIRVMDRVVLLRSPDLGGAVGVAGFARTTASNRIPSYPLTNQNA